MVGVPKSFPRDWDEIRVEHALSDPLRPSMTVVAVVRAHRTLEDRLQSVRGIHFEQASSTDRHRQQTRRRRNELVRN
jgi:hypothetical protein